jgi:hypothetical protein
MAAISVGYDADTVAGLGMPFRESASYLGMHWLGHVYAWVENGKVAEAPKEELLKICGTLKNP